MQETNQLILISFLTITGMIVISGIIYYSERDRRQWQGFEYWLSSGCYLFLTMLTTNSTQRLVALPTILWLWRVRCIRKILEEVCHAPLARTWHYVLLLFSFFLSLILALYEWDFVYYTFPQSAAVFIVIMSVLWEGVKTRFLREKVSVNHYLLFFTVFIIAVHCLDYPFFRYNTDYTSLGFGILLLTNILMAIILPSATIYDLKHEQEKKLLLLIEKRGELLKAQSKLSALGEMTAGMAHELNNPLGIVIQRYNMLKAQLSGDTFDKESLSRGLDQLHETAKRMLQIIQSLKNFSRENKKEDFKECTLSSIFEETLSYCRDRFRLEAIELMVDAYPGDKISCRPVQLSQVLLNLLNNSFEAVSKKGEGWVHISFIKKDYFQKILVTDSGMRIPTEISSRMMEPFFTTKENTGTGLGLSLSRQIIEEHGGKLYYDESQINTTFVIEIPIRA